MPGSTLGRRSLRHRLLRLAFLPLVVVLPVILAVLMGLGGARYDQQLASGVRTHLAAAHNYLEQQRIQTETHLEQLVQSERLRSLLSAGEGPQTLDVILQARADAARLDFLIIVDPQGRVIASSTHLPPGSVLAHSGVLSQAMTGMLSSGYERFEPAALASWGAALPARAVVSGAASDGAMDGSVEHRALLVMAAAHFPLSLNYPDAVLVGGMLLNNNQQLVDRLREVVFPITPGTEDSGGVATLFLGDLRIATNVEVRSGQRATGTRVSPPVAQQVLVDKRPWVGPAQVLERGYLSGYEPLLGLQGEALGMLFVGFPERPFLLEKWGLFGAVALLLVLSLAAAAAVFSRGTRGIVRRLHDIMGAMRAVEAGQPGVRLPEGEEGDELSALSRHFNQLLDSLRRQESARAQAQQALRNEAERRRSLFQQVRDGLVVLAEDGRVLEANPRFAQMLGYSPDEALRLHVWDWDEAFADARVHHVLPRVPEHGALVQAVHRRKDGSCYEAEVSLSTVHWGGSAYVLALHRDVSERHQMVAELAEHRNHLEAIVARRTLELALARDEAESANRAKSSFLANMSHELRTPLNGLMGMVHLARRQTPDPQQQARLDQALVAAEQLLGVINDVLDITQLEASRLVLKPVDFSLGAVLGALDEGLAPQASARGLAWRVDLPEALASRPLRGDAGRLSQVLQGLLDNAIKFSDAGSVSLVVRVQDERLAGCTLRFEVIDTGIGLSEADQERLFRPFEQVDSSSTRRYAGSGLGLAVAQRLVRLMGGEMGVHSAVGQGSSFWFTVALEQGGALTADLVGPPLAAVAGAEGDAAPALTTSDPAHWAALHQRLSRCLADNDYEAVHLLDEHLALLRARMGADAPRFFEALRAFDFPEALELLARVAPQDSGPP